MQGWRRAIILEIRKRIRLHELRVGMFVEELENLPQRTGDRFSPFLISTPAEIARLMRSKVMSVVINVQKGLDIAPRTQQGSSFDRQAAEVDLLSRFPRQDVETARRAIEDTKPDIRNILAEARFSGGFAAKAANTAVERIMASAMHNAGALIGVAKLKASDEVTYLHSLAVSALMITFGRNLGFDEDKVRLLGIGGLVHDLGKMTLPRSILMKPGKLTADETGIMETHPQRGYQLVSKIEDTPQEVLDICLFHHEKFDGTGYPRRLVGAQIPHVARIAAICDVYDALTTIRPYKRALSQGEAIDIMMTSEGHFDHDLLSAFLSKMIINGTIH